MRSYLIVCLALLGIIANPNTSSHQIIYSASAMPPLTTMLVMAVTAPPFVDILLKSICQEESQGEPTPQWAVNPHGSAWGECQIKYWSAVAFGQFDEQMRRKGKPSRSPGDLFDPEVNRATAQHILDRCRARYRYSSNKRLAYCYYAGPSSRFLSDRKGAQYATVVAARVKTWRTKTAKNKLDQMWNTVKFSDTL